MASTNEQAGSAREVADELCAEARAAAADIPDPVNRFAFQVGYLESTVRDLCEELEAHRSVNRQSGLYERYAVEVTE